MVNNSNYDFQKFDTNKTRLAAFETQRKSSLIKPVSIIYSVLKKLVIKSPSISTLDKLANTIHESLTPYIDISTLIVNFEGTVSSRGKSIDINEEIFEVIWNKEKFGITYVTVSEKTYTMFFSAFDEDQYLMLFVDKFMRKEDRHYIITALKNFPALLGRSV